VAEILFRGGSRIGWVNASWPLARLSLSTDRLTISGMGNVEFTPSQVVSFERYGSIPLLASGIRINHNRLDCPEAVVFWCMGSREAVFSAIAHSGFHPSGLAISRVGGFPVRWSVVIAFVVMWNALFLLDNPFGSVQPHTLGPFSLIALLLAFGFVTAIQKSAWLQQVVMRSGHQVGEIKSFLLLLQVVSGFLSLGFGASLLLRGYVG
jgi:hypothetical protein